MKLAALATWLWAAASLSRAIARGSSCQETDIECRLLESDDELLDETSSVDDQASHRKLVVEGASGTLNILVLPISWADRPEDRTLPTTDELNELWNGVGVGDNYPSGSIANWTYTNSHGSLTLSVTIAPWITSDNTEVFYADGNSGRPAFTDDVNGTSTNVYDAIEDALGALESQGFDFSPFDQDNDGVLDAVAVLHSGYSAEQAEIDCYGRAPSDRIQSHRASAPASSTGWSGPGGLRLGSYTIASTYIGVCNAKLARLGVIVHEMIHLFNFPELYDVAQAFEGSSTNVGGVGGFDVMYVLQEKSFSMENA
jgi:M6 family metalloprotease-like protein